MTSRDLVNGEFARRPGILRPAWSPASGRAPAELVEGGDESGPLLNLAHEATSRRRFLLLGAATAFLVGCETTPKTASLPDPVWPSQPTPPRYQPPAPPSATTPPAPTPPSSGIPGVISRGAWAKGNPVPSMMNPMLPIAHITIHHDGMSPFLAVDSNATHARIELIRVSHRNRKDPWGDIGYHFIIDRAGRVYEGRPLIYQGAHVKNHNEGNIGVLCLGNFESHAPSDAQLRALAAHVKTLRTKFRVSESNVRTHREWKGAQTLCPGRSLQTKVVALRTNRAFA